MIDFNALQGEIGGSFNPSSLGEVISRAIPYVFAIAGILLLLYLLYAGFQLMTSAGDTKAVQAAKAKITSALIGFVIIFIAFWLVQIFGQVLGLEPVIEIFR